VDERLNFLPNEKGNDKSEELHGPGPPRARTDAWGYGRLNIRNRLLPIRSIELNVGNSRVRVTEMNTLKKYIDAENSSHPL
jgi:hypothetical protein